MGQALLENVQVSDLGQAKKITVDKDTQRASLNGSVDPESNDRISPLRKGRAKMGHPEHAEIEGRLKEIRSQVEKTTSDYDREKLQERPWS